MEKLARNKPLFIGLSALSIGCLIGSFGYPLQKLEVYSQQELGAFGNAYTKNFIITESDRNYPYGFRKDKAQLIAQIYQDYKLQKIFLLILAGLSAFYALQIGAETVPNAEIDSEIDAIKSQGKKQLLLESIKHKMALASKAQRQLFIEEMKVLMDEFGSPEEEILEADEINALYEQAMVDGEDPASSAPNFRAQFPESMDAASKKAVDRAKADGLSEDEILKDVLACSASAMAEGREYLKFLS